MKTISSARVPLIDGLRGFALLGIILAHYGRWHDGWSLPQEVTAAYQNDTLSQIIWTFDGIFVTGKFFAFFSFLFGVSFGLMLLRTSDSRATFLGRFAWRIALLGLIGLLHHLHWAGDILSIYAIVGFGLLLFSGASNAVILTVAILLILNVPARLQDLYFSIQKIDSNQFWGDIFSEESSKQYLKVIREGKYTPFVLENWSLFPKKMIFQISSGRLYITFGFFLLGFWFARNQFLQNFDQHRPFFKKMMIRSAVGALAIVAIFLGLQFSGIFSPTSPPPAWLMPLFSTLFDLLNACMVMVYVAGMSFLLLKKSWQKILDSLAAIGKMALTSYLTQTAVAWFVFFGFGLGLLGRVSPAVGYGIGIGVFLLQILLSRFWLSRFAQGPVEWLWRRLIYLW